MSEKPNIYLPHPGGVDIIVGKAIWDRFKSETGPEDLEFVTAPTEPCDDKHCPGCPACGIGVAMDERLMPDQIVACSETGCQIVSELKKINGIPTLEDEE